MMCHPDKTSCSRYNITTLGRGAAATRNAFWGEREVCDEVAAAEWRQRGGDRM